MKQLSPKQLELGSALSRFSGTTTHYQHMTGFLYTDGVQFLADTYKTHWVLREIFFANYPTPFADFQIWKLKRVIKRGKKRTNAFVLVCEDGDYNHLKTIQISSSDFPADFVELWFSGTVLYLPSEH